MYFVGCGCESGNGDGERERDILFYYSNFEMMSMEMRKEI